MSKLKAGDIVTGKNNWEWMHHYYAKITDIDDKGFVKLKYIKTLTSGDTQFHDYYKDWNWNVSELIKVEDQPKTRLSKKEFDKLYVGENIVVHCPTEELANEFLKEAERHGYKWALCSKDKYDRTNCYEIIDKYISAGSFYFYFHENYKIVEFYGFNEIL